MKNFTKKWVSFLLAVMMIFNMTAGAVPVRVSARDEETQTARQAVTEGEKTRPEAEPVQTNTPRYPQTSEGNVTAPPKAENPAGNTETTPPEGTEAEKPREGEAPKPEETETPEADPAKTPAPGKTEKPAEAPENGEISQPENPEEEETQKPTEALDTDPTENPEEELTKDPEENREEDREEELTPALLSEENFQAENNNGEVVPFVLTFEADDGTPLALAAYEEYDYDDNKYVYGVTITRYYPDDPNLPILLCWYMDKDGYIRWYPSYFSEAEDAHNRYLEVNLNGANSPLFSLSCNYDTEPLKNPDSSSSDYRGYVPLTLEKSADDNYYLKFFDPKHTIDNEPDYFKNNPSYPVFTLGNDISINGISKTPSGIIFQKVETEVEIPKHIDYDLEKLDWDIIPKEDGTYDVTVTGKLNESYHPFPSSDMFFYLNDVFIGGTELFTSPTEFTVSSVGKVTIPDAEEASFQIRIIEDRFLSSYGPGPNTVGWCLSPLPNAVFGKAVKEIHESTTTVPAEAVWADADTVDHSDDTVTLTLIDNGEKTDRTITLDRSTDWKGEFKHVPGRRWTYSKYRYPWNPNYATIPRAGETTISNHEYTVEEAEIRGYTAEYSDVQPGDGGTQRGGNKEKKPYAVQLVCEDKDTGELLAIRTWGKYKLEKYDSNNFSQVFNLYGDNALVAGNGTHRYYLEKSESGNYRIYSFGQKRDEDGILIGLAKEYFPSEIYLLPDDPDNLDMERTHYDINNAREFKLFDFTGAPADDPNAKPMTEMPEDILYPYETVLKIYDYGKSLGMEMDTGYVYDSEFVVRRDADGNPTYRGPLGASKYDKENVKDSQLFEVYPYGDDLLIFPQDYYLFANKISFESSNRFKAWTLDLGYMQVTNGGRPGIFKYNRASTEEEATIFGIDPEALRDPNSPPTVKVVNKPTSTPAPTPDNTDNPAPTPSQNPTPTPSQNPTPTPAQNPTPTPVPSNPATPNTTNTPTAPSATAAPSPDTGDNANLTVWFAVLGLSAAGLLAVWIVRKKSKNQQTK